MSELIKNITEMFENKDMNRLKEVLNQQEYYDLVQLFSELEAQGNRDELAVLFRLLNKDLSLVVFEDLSLETQESLIQSLTGNRAVEIITEMEPDDRARLLDEVPAKVAKQLLNSIPADERKKTADLLNYPAETAGRIMTPEYVSLKADMSAEEALERIRSKRKSAETIYVLYVTDAKRRLLGVLSLGDLVTVDRSSTIRDIMNEKVIKVHTETDQEEAAVLLKERDLLAVPVVDREDRLVGIITVDDAMDILEEEATEDIMSKAGLGALTKQETGRSQRLIEGPVWDVWKVRMPFLVITLIGGMLAGAVIDAYEATLEAIAAVAIFIPVIMDMGGNAGTQSSTIFTRAFVLGHISIKRFGYHLTREAGIGLSMGAMMGLAAGIIASAWQGEPSFGLAVGISLAMTMTLATALGFLIPFILVRLGMDQAAGSDPFITTIKDISGLFIYFTFVSIFLGHLM